MVPMTPTMTLIRRTRALASAMTWLRLAPMRDLAR